MGGPGGGTIQWLYVSSRPNSMLVCIYAFQICNIFHNLDSSFYPIWTSCKVLFQKQMGQIWDIVFTSSCTIEKLAIIWLIFPIIWWLHTKVHIVKGFFSLSFSYSFFYTQEHYTYHNFHSLQWWANT